MKYLILLISLFFISCQSNQKIELTKEFTNPASGYTQVVTTTANGIKTIYVSGQVGQGDDLKSQMTSALENLRSQLEQAGAGFKDIVKMNHYIVNYKPEDLAVFRNTRKEIMGDEDMPASTLVGVTSLVTTEYLIEIEAIAVIEE